MIQHLQINNSNDLLDAFTNETYKDCDLILDINSDISIHNTSPVNGSIHYNCTIKKTIVINGNGNSITSIADIGTSKTGFAYPITKESSYKLAQSRVEHEDGSEVSKDDVSRGIYRVKLNDADKSATINNFNYINLSVGWTAYTWEITKIENGYVYFTSNGSEYSMDYDWYQGNHQYYTNYKLIRAPKHSSTNLEAHTGRYLFEFISNKYNNLSIKINNLTIKGGIKCTKCNIELYNCIISDCSEYGLYLQECDSLFTYCKFLNIWKSAIYAKRTPYYTKHVKDGEIWYTLINEKNKSLHSTLTCKICSFINANQSRTNVGTIHTDGNYLIDYNEFIDCPSFNVFVGISNMPFNWLADTEIVNNNTFVIKNDTGTTIDTGCIYVAPNNKNCYITNNKILNYNGRENNHGIYLDDGAYNVTVESNYVNAKTGYAISARNAGIVANRGYGGGVDNTFKHILSNECVHGGIWCGGKNNVSKNNCIVKFNIIREDINTKFNSALSFVLDIYNTIIKQI